VRRATILVKPTEYDLGWFSDGGHQTIRSSKATCTSVLPESFGWCGTFDSSLRRSNHHHDCSASLLHDLFRAAVKAGAYSVYFLLSNLPKKARRASL